MNGEDSDIIEMMEGVKQWCALASTLFIVLLEFLRLAIQSDLHDTGVSIHCHTDNEEEPYFKLPQLNRAHYTNLDELLRLLLLSAISCPSQLVT